jgi:hypothetical protein
MDELLIKILLMLGSGFIGAWFNEFFRNRPIFSLRFSLGNKNIEAFDLKIGLEVKKGLAKNIVWYVEYTGTNEKLKDYFDFQKGNFQIVKEGEAKYLFSVNSDDYKNFELWKYVRIIVKYNFIFGIKFRKKLVFDLKELPLEDAIKHKELVELSSYLREKAKEGIKNLFKNAHATRKNN